MGASTTSKKRRASESPVWGLLGRASDASKVHWSHRRAEESFDVKERSFCGVGRTFKKMSRTCCATRETALLKRTGSQGLDDDDDEARNVFCEEHYVEELRSPQRCGWRSGRQWSNHVHLRLRALQAAPGGGLLLVGCLPIAKKDKITTGMSGWWVSAHSEVGGRTGSRGASP